MGRLPPKDLERRGGEARLTGSEGIAAIGGGKDEVLEPHELRHRLTIPTGQRRHQPVVAKIPGGDVGRVRRDVLELNRRVDRLAFVEDGPIEMAPQLETEWLRLADSARQPAVKMS